MDAPGMRSYPSIIILNIQFPKTTRFLGETRLLHKTYYIIYRHLFAFVFYPGHSAALCVPDPFSQSGLHDILYRRWTRSIYHPGSHIWGVSTTAVETERSTVSHRREIKGIKVTMTLSLFVCQTHLTSTTKQRCSWLGRWCYLLLSHS